MTRSSFAHARRSRRRAVARRRMGGQASILVVIVAAILVIAALMVYNAGRLVVTRIHLQNAADSAAYSGAVELARAYNFSSYANRAMVANQVAIAQAVGLASWARYYCLIYTDASCGKFNTNGTAEEIQAALEVGDEAGGEPGETVMSAYQTISSGIFDGINTAAGPLVSVLNGIEIALGNASQAYYAGAIADLGLSAVNSGGVMQRVLTATDPNAQIATAALGNANALGGVAQGLTAVSLVQIGKFVRVPFIQPYEPNNYSTNNNADPNNRFHNVVMASRDAFSKGRSSNEIAPFTSLIWSAGTCLGDGFGGIIINSTGYSGSTTLSTDNKTWTTGTGGDTSAFLGTGICVIEVPTPVGPIPVPIPLIIPISPATGFANVTAGTSDQYTLSGSFYSGLQNYIDVTDLKAADYDAPTLSIFAAREAGTIATTQQLNAGTSGTQARQMPIATGSFALSDSEGSGVMLVGASAQVYFIRPSYSDETTLASPPAYQTLGGATLYASLFSPYWEAHLVPTPPLVKAAVMGAEAVF